MFVEIDGYIFNALEISLVSDHGSFVTVHFRDGSQKCFNSITYQAFLKAIFKDGSK